MPLPDGINSDDLTNVPAEYLQAVIDLQKAYAPFVAAKLQLDDANNKVKIANDAIAAAKPGYDAARAKMLQVQDQWYLPSES